MEHNETIELIEEEIIKESPADDKIKIDELIQDVPINENMPVNENDDKPVNENKNKNENKKENENDNKPVNENKKENEKENNPATKNAKENDETLERNNTSFSANIKEALERAFKSEPKTAQDTFLKYYQRLTKSYFDGIMMGTVRGTRGLLISHVPGAGKSITSIAIALSAIGWWDNPSNKPHNRVIVILLKSLQENYIKNIDRVLDQMNVDRASVHKKFHYVAFNASNMIKQLWTVTNSDVDPTILAEQYSTEISLGDMLNSAGSLDNTLVIVDEFHLLLRAITNGSKNGHAFYEVMMKTRSAKLLALSGSIISNNSFEISVCYNLISGQKIFPERYDDFIRIFCHADGSLRDEMRAKFQNRISGLTSYISMNDIAKDDFTPREMPDKIVRVKMTDYQTSLYINARRDEEREMSYKSGVSRFLTKPKSDMVGSYKQKSRQLSNFAPPEYFVEEKKKNPKLSYIFIKDVDSPKFDALYSNLNLEGTHVVYSQFTGAGGLGSLQIYLNNKGASKRAFGKAIFNTDIKEEKIQEKIKEEKIKEEIKNAPEFQSFTPPPEAIIEDAVPIMEKIEEVGELKNILLEEVEGRIKEDQVNKGHPYNPDKQNKIPTIGGSGNIIELIDVNPDYENNETLGFELIDIDGADENKTENETKKINENKTENETKNKTEYINENKNENIKENENINKTDDETFTTIDKSTLKNQNFKYALFTGDELAEEREEAVRIMSSKDNINGDQIKVLMISSAGALGVDISNCRYIHILEPYWTEDRMIQVKGRIRRLNSARDLPPDQRFAQAFIYLAYPNMANIENANTDLYKSTDEELYIHARDNAKSINSWISAIHEISIECSFLADYFKDGRICRMCAPTNQKLFSDDLARDIREVDPCQPYNKKEIEAETITIDGVEVSYTTDGVVEGYVFDIGLNAFRRLSHGDKLYDKLLSALEISR